MGGERRNMPEQERSIKDREQELFFEPEDVAVPTQPLKPFPVYLQETPANPISPAVKIILWIVGILVGLLFLAALWRTHRPHGRPRAVTKSPRAEASAQAPTAPYPPLVRNGTMRPWGPFSVAAEMPPICTGRSATGPASLPESNGRDRRRIVQAESLGLG
jgi:hypothetical protein